MQIKLQKEITYWLQLYDAQSIVSDALYRPTISVEIGNDGVSVLVHVQPPSPLLPMATIVNYQVIATNSNVEEAVIISSSTTYVGSNKFSLVSVRVFSQVNSY